MSGVDFTYVTDVRRVNERLLTDDSADSEILNIGSTDNVDIRTLATLVYDKPREGDTEHTHAMSRRPPTCWATSRQ
jgi:UDP-glucose 4-epimerase